MCNDFLALRGFLLFYLSLIYVFSLVWSFFLKKNILCNSNSVVNFIN